jgi:hypothetical protein
MKMWELRGTYNCHVVELPKLDVTGSIPVARSKLPADASVSCNLLWPESDAGTVLQWLDLWYPCGLDGFDRSRYGALTLTISSLKL